MKTAEEIQKELENLNATSQILILEQWEIEIRIDQIKKDRDETFKTIGEVLKKSK